MRYLIIVDDYFPHSIKVAAQLIHDLASEFKRQNHDITILTPKPKQKEKLINTEYKGVNVLYFKSGVIKNTNKIRRTINELLLPFYAYNATKQYFKQNTYDGIIFYSPTIFWGPLVKKLKNKWNCKSYLILRDIFPQWVIDNKILSKNAPITWLFRFFEKLNYNAADKIGVMSNSNLNYFQNRYKNADKFEVLPNWSKITIPNKENISKRIDIRSQYNLEDKIIFFYGGNIGHAQHIINLVNLANEFKAYENIHFLFVGEGDKVDLIKSEKDKRQLNNITYHPAVDQETYLDILSDIDIGMFSLHPNHTTHNFPGKLLGYMLYEKPIIGFSNKGNDLLETINSNHAGLVVENSQLTDLVNFILFLIDKPEQRIEIGKNARKLLQEKFSVENSYEIISNNFR